MNLKILIIGTLLLIVGNALLRLYLNYQESISPGSDAILFYLPAIEAILYSVIVLLAFEIKEASVLVLIPGIMAVTNFVLDTYGFLFMSFIIGTWSGFAMPSIYMVLIVLVILAIFGALIFCSVLNFYSVTKFVTLMPVVIAFLCSFSAISAFFIDTDWFFIINKTIWWVMFSLGIYISKQYSNNYD